jgi:hypothetical protein
MIEIPQTTTTEVTVRWTASIATCGTFRLELMLEDIALRRWAEGLRGIGKSMVAAAAVPAHRGVPRWMLPLGGERAPARHSASCQN